MSGLVVAKSIAFIFSLGFIFLAWLSKKMVGFWLNPSSIFSFFWALYTIFPLLFAFDAPINPFSVLYILCFNICFISTVFIFNWRFAFSKNLLKPSARIVFDTALLRTFFFGISTVTICALFFSMFYQQFSVAELFADPIRFAGNYANKRYNKNIEANLFSTLGLMTSYITVVIGGLLYGANSRKKLYILFFSFIPSLLVMFLQSAKGLLFLSIFVFVGGMFISRIYDKKYNLLNWYALKRVIALGALILPAVMVSFLSRGLYGYSDDFIWHKLESYIISYSSGHLYAFSDWFSFKYFSDSIFLYDDKEHTLGFYSFMSLFRLFGDDREIPMGVYSEFFFYSDYLRTNIYTVFRGLITDFTLLGSFVVSALAGLTVNFFFFRLLCSLLNPFYIVFFVFFVAISYQTFVVSTLTWTVIPVVFVLMVCFLFVYFLNLRRFPKNVRG